MVGYLNYEVYRCIIFFFFYIVGNDFDLIKKILDFYFLSKIIKRFSILNEIIKEFGFWVFVWVGEVGGVFNNGGYFVFDIFVNSFW